LFKRLYFSQLLDFILIFFADWRGVLWPFVLFYGIIMPTGIMWLLRTASGGHISYRTAVYYITGSLITSFVFSAVSHVLTRIGYARQQKQLDFWASLPVPKIILITALFLVSLTVAAPGVAGVMIAAYLILNITFHLTIGALLALFLGAMTMASIAAVLGVLAPDAPSTNLISNATAVITMFVAPVYIPLDQLPQPLRYLAYILPPTYVAQALRSAMLDQQASLGIYLAVLVVMVIVSFTLVHFKLDWRSNTPS